MTDLRISNILGAMDPELSSLEEKLSQVVQRLKTLRDENSRLGEKLATAKTRIEALLKQIPETES